MCDMGVHGKVVGRYDLGVHIN